MRGAVRRSRFTALKIPTRHPWTPPAEQHAFQGQQGAATAIVVLIGIAAVYWLWLALDHRSITTDPAISILTAQSILRHGYPLLPSGFIYDRAYLPNYLLAASIRLFGLNDLSVGLPSIVLGLGSLYLTYLIARDILGRPWLGVAAVAVLVTVQVNSIYAVSPRMYMSLQFFTMLAVYASWRGYARGEPRFTTVTLVAVAAAFLTHHQGGILTAGIPLSLLTVSALERGRLPPVRELRRFTGLLGLAVIFVVFFLWYELPQSLQQIALRGGVASSLSGLNLSPHRWLSQVNWLEQGVPLGLLLAPAVALMAIGALRERRSHAGQGGLFLLLVFAFWALGIFGYVRVSGSRFWMGIAPIYLLIVLHSLRGPSRMREIVTRIPLPHVRRRFLGFAGASILWAAVVVLGYSLYYGPRGYARILKAGYGVPCSVEGEGCSREVKAKYRALSTAVGDDDVVVSTNPFVTSYYLGRLDAWLVQRRSGSAHTTFQSPADEYFGAPMVDDELKLAALQHDPRRVWILVHGDRDLSDSMITQLRETFHPHGEPGPFAIYVNSVDPPF